MGRKSRATWERRRTPMRPPGEPLETRWGTTPLARAFGGMVKGLMLGGGVAVACLAVGALRIVAAGASPDMEGFAGDLARVAGGFLLAGRWAARWVPSATASGDGGRRGPRWRPSPSSCGCPC